MKKIIIFLGAPGSGKGTQAKKIAARHGYAHLSTGDLLRRRYADQETSEAEKSQLDLVIKQGKLAPDQLIYDLVFSEIQRVLKNQPGVVLDGAIRNLSQAKEFNKFFIVAGLQDDVAVVNVHIPDEESLVRLSSRRLCSACGEIVTITKGNENVSCPKCGGKLIMRSDDNAETIKKRVAAQGNQAIAPLLEFYNRLGLVKTVDGTKTISEVEEEIEKVLK